MTDTAAKVLKQVEFYFSDSNLPRDKFLSGLVSKNEKGFVPIATIASFKRMKALTTDMAAIVAALRTSEALLEVDEKGENVRRTTPVDPEASKDSCWVYAKGFDKETSTLESITEFLSTHGTVKCVRLRRYDVDKFKGSVFAEFATEAEAKAFLAAEIKSPVTFKVDGEPSCVLLTMPKADYVAQKKAEYEARKSKKRARSGDDTKDDKPKPELVKDRLIKIEGVPDTSSREDMKEAVQAVGGTVRHVDFSRGLTSGVVRLQDNDAQGAAALVAKLSADKAEIMGTVPTYSALTGDDETQYWNDIFERMRARRASGYGRKRQRR